MDDLTDRVDFDELAPRYDLVNALISAGLAGRWRRALVALVGARPGDRVLDLCCGTGRVARELERGGARVVGVDLSHGMLIRADGGCRRVRGAAEELPLADESCDAATVAWGLRNVCDRAAVIGELVRVVRPGGRVASLDMAEPASSCWRRMYWWYFARIVPLVGACLTGRREAYECFHRSTRAFVRPEELAREFVRAGLHEPRIHSLLGGALAIVVARKGEFPCA